LSMAHRMPRFLRAQNAFWSHVVERQTCAGHPDKGPAANPAQVWWRDFAGQVGGGQG